MPRLSSEIISCPQMDTFFDTVGQLTTRDLVVCDVDQVLIEAKDHVLSGQGDAYKLPWLNAAQHSLDQDIFDLLYSIIIRDRPVRLTDPRWPNILTHLKGQNIPTAALTAFWNGPYGVLKDVGLQRLEQMRDLGLALNPLHLINTKEHAFTDVNPKRPATPPTYRDGVMFTCYVPKGEALKAFLTWADHKPKRVIFLDDRVSHLKSVQAACADLGIDFVGYHVTLCYDPPQKTNKDLANFQFSYLYAHKQWLSDQEATKLMKTTSLPLPTFAQDLFFDESA